MAALYLQESEIEEYCTVIDTVETSDINMASRIIDAYCGRSFEKREVSETIRLKVKKTRGVPNLLGKFKNYPIGDVIEVKSVFHSMFGMTEEILDNSSISLQDAGYFYLVGVGFNTKMFGVVPNSVLVKYSYGYSEGEYPETLKMACAMLAQNLKQAGGYLNFTSKKDIDYSVTFADSSIFTKDIKILLDELRFG